MKKRIDVLLYEKGIAKSREKAKAQIIAGSVLADGRPVRSPSETYEEEGVVVTLKEETCPYVSRGGLKLKKAVDSFSLDLTGLVCADIGASTGGFTDCMLKHGASHVYAVDVGYGQIDWALRNDDRVSVLERTNARYLESLGQNVDFVSIDVSFISLALIFPAVIRISTDDVGVVALIKPQFEAGKEKVGKKGVVRDANVHMEVIVNVEGFAKQNGLYLENLNYSPVKGPNGNIEYLAYFTKNMPTEEIQIQEVARQVVDLAHENLK